MDERWSLLEGTCPEACKMLAKLDCALRARIGANR